MSTATTPGSDMAKLPPPPEPGTPIVRVVEYYTETARRFVPSFDLELVPLSGKNPGVGGLAWQSHASSDPEAVLAHLKALGSAGRRVDGLGALMNRHICFDVDHPEFLPAKLGELLAGALVNETRPGRRHFIFRVPVGRRFGGRKDLLNSMFPSEGNWGEVKGFNSQVRIWSPNDDGTHVRLRPGVATELYVELAAGLLEPEFLFGDPYTDAALDDWLDEHTGNLHPEWLADDLAKLPNIDPDDVDPSKNRRLLRRTYHVGINIAAGMYPGRRAYDALHDAWVGLCLSEGDYVTDGGPGDHERKYRGIWRRCVGKLNGDPGAQAAVEEKRRASWGGEPWDPEHNEADQILDEWWRAWAAREGVTVKAEPSALTAAEVTALLTAVEGDEADSPSPGGQVLDMAERVAARLARLEAKSGIPVLPALPAQTTTAPPANGGESAGSEIAETRDEEIRGSSGEGAVGTAAGAVAAGGSPASSSPVTGGSSWEDFCEAILESQRDLVTVEMRNLAVREVAAAQRRLMSGVGEITAEDFDDLDTAAVLEPPPALMLVNAAHGLLYEDAVTMMIGDKATGKSWLMAAEALVQMRLGRSVAWLDWEMSASRMRARLLSLGARSADVRGRWWYLGMHGGEFRDARKALAGIPPGTLVVVDSVSAALGSGGSDEDKASEYGPWIAAVKQFRAEAQACVVLIDHTGHSNKTRARGSSAKGQQADVEFTVSVVDPWTRVSAGWASLACRKDRGGHLKLERPSYGAFFTPGLRGGLGSGSLDVEVRELNEWEIVFAERALLDERERAKAAREAAAEAERAERRARVLEVLADGETHPRAEVAAEAALTEKECRGVVDGLIDDGLVEAIGTRGRGAGVRLVDPERDESDESES